MNRKINALVESFLDWWFDSFCNPYQINPQGNCPVQAEGTLPTGEWYYFRARGRQWSMDICESEGHWNSDKYLFQAGERNAFEWPAGGWLARWKAMQLATNAVNEYYESEN